MSTNKEVYWNPNEKIIGVIGVAPFATLDFYHKLVSLNPANKDWEHVRVIIDSNPKIPSRGRYLELGEADPTPNIRQSISGLVKMGADIIALPCNTAHILFDRYVDGFSVFIPNMIEETIKYLYNICEKPPKRILVLSSKLTQEYLLYNNFLEPLGVEVVDVTDLQSQISFLIEQVKQGKSIDNLKKIMQEILLDFDFVDACIIGCTELSLLLPNNSKMLLIDSNLALARACLTKSENISYSNSIA